MGKSFTKNGFQNNNNSVVKQDGSRTDINENPTEYDQTYGEVFSMQGGMGNGFGAKSKYHGKEFVDMTEFAGGVSRGLRRIASPSTVERFSFYAKWVYEMAKKFDKYFGKPINLWEGHDNLEKPYIVNTERMHPTIITKDFGPDPIFKNSNNVLYENEHHKQSILRTRGTYNLGDTINYWEIRTWSDGRRDSIPIYRK